MFILVVELNLAKCRLPKGFESSKARKNSLEGGNQDPGDPGVGKVRGERIFFSFKQGGLTLDDTMSYHFPHSHFA